MTVGLTKALGGFVAGLEFRDIPAAAVAVARTGFTDCIAAMVAGGGEAAVRAVRDTVLPLAGEGRASLLFGDGKAPAPLAAWVNGTAAHALDYDDVALLGHPSAVLVPAILAEAEERDAPGRTMVAAYVAGYEVWAELLWREQGLHRGKGWHPTGVFGTVAAAAGGAVMSGLGPEEATHALGIAASDASGVAANFGSMTKPFHAGRAAFAGLIAARLAGAGMTAAADALEHPNGFLAAISPAGEVDRSSPADRLGHDWQIVAKGLGVKRYPLCYAAHRAIDAMLELLETRAFTAGDVERIVATLGRAQAAMLRHADPQNPLEAKFSIEFALAAAIIAGRVSLHELEESFLARPDIRELMGRVAVDMDEEADPELPSYAPFDMVRVELKSGEVLKSTKVRRARGHPSKPLPPDALWTKFSECVEPRLGGERTGRLFERLQAIDSLPTARALLD